MDQQNSEQLAGATRCSRKTDPHSGSLYESPSEWEEKGRAHVIAELAGPQQQADSSSQSRPEITGRHGIVKGN